MSHLSPQDFSGLGDSMRVGPQYQMPTSRAVPLIERGPHGAPLYPASQAIPGRGFVFWNQYDSGDWNAINHMPPRARAPKQEILSLLGMGDLLPEASMLDKRKWTALSKELHSQAKSFEKSLLPPLISKAKALASVVNQHRSWDDGFLGAWDSQQRITIRARQALTIAQSRLQGHAPPAGALAPIPKPGGVVENVPGAVSDEIRRGAADVIGSAEKYYEDVKKDQLKAFGALAVLGLGAIFLYGASQGVGAGVGRRISR